MKQGEIFELKDEFRSEYHPSCYNHSFIYWENEGSDIRGIMLTTSKNYGNIPLNEEHFKEGFKLSFGKSSDFPISYIAPLYLLKEIEYNHFEKTGELTDEGIKFISTIVCKLPFTDWMTYKKGKIG